MARPGYKFTNKKNPEKGIMSSALGAISVVSTALALYFTYLAEGVAKAQYGSVVCLALLFSVVGLVLGIMSYLERDIYKFFPVLGIVLNIIGIIGAGFILYIGLS